MKRRFLVFMLVIISACACVAGICACNKTPDENNTDQSNSEFTVCFDANGGEFYDGETSFSITDQSVDSVVMEPTAPSREGYIFKGWSTSKYVTLIWDFKNDRISKDTTLYALWQTASRDEEVIVYTEQQRILNETSLNYSSLANAGKTEILSEAQVLKAKEEGVLSSVEYSDENIPVGKKVIYKKHTAAYGMDDLSYYGANNNITFLGSLLKVNAAGTALAPITGLKRKPLTISLGLEGATGVDYQSRTIDSIQVSTVGQAINELVKGFTTEQAQLPYMLSMQLTEIKAREEINAALGLQFNVGSFFNMSSEFDFNSKGEQTYAILTLKQVYFTVNADYNAEDGVFSILDDSVTLKQIGNACSREFCPVYVSSVSYGRIAAITIKTSKNFKELEASLNLGGKIMITKGELSSEVSGLNKLEDLQCNYFVYGGSIDGNQNVLNENSINGMIKCLNQPYDPKKQVGLPISYQLSHISDNSPARIGFVGEYYSSELVDEDPKLADGKKLSVTQNIDKEITVNDNYGNYDVYGAGYIANNYFLRIDISQLDLAYIKNSCQNLEIIIEMSIKEENDGYQEIYVYNEKVIAGNVQSRKSKPLASTIVEHTVDAKNPNYEKYSLKAVISTENIGNEVWIAFDAYGHNEDTWKAKDFTVTIGATNNDIMAMYAVKV